MIPSETADPIHDPLIRNAQPLLSVIVPVYNAASKVEGALQRIQTNINQLESIMWNVELQRSKIEYALLATGEFRANSAIPTATGLVSEEQQRLLMCTGGDVGSAETEQQASAQTSRSGRADND
ncbi:MAG: hypothetical protein MN733_17945, partial [Nitrososphaera sp.]|nr:hypothetical protein [Nitrososphaera sp.]